jgi:hypothetical protein
MKLKDFVINKQDDKDVILGKGSFATVYLATNIIDNNKYAIKMVF